MSHDLQTQVDELKRELAKKDNEITDLKKAVEQMKPKLIFLQLVER
jgi:predicted  nucleic acid-binding Zn-ribbon protein